MIELPLNSIQDLLNKLDKNEILYVHILMILYITTPICLLGIHNKDLKVIELRLIDINTCKFIGGPYNLSPNVTDISFGPLNGTPTNFNGIMFVELPQLDDDSEFDYIHVSVDSDPFISPIYTELIHTQESEEDEEYNTYIKDLLCLIGLLSKLHFLYSESPRDKDTPSFNKPIIHSIKEFIDKLEVEIKTHLNRYPYHLSLTN